jgi:hypothetical protein
MVCVWLVALLAVSSYLPTGSYFSWDWIGFYQIKGLDYLYLYSLETARINPMNPRNSG